MGYAEAAEALLRRKMLEEMYDRLTPEERRQLAMMSMQRRSDGEIMRAIQENRQQLERLLEKAESGRWYTAFGSDVAANVVTTAGFWLLSRLLNGK